MKTSMADTSLDAYRSLPVREYLQPREQAIMDLMADGKPRTQEQMAETLGWTINKVNPRVNSLASDFVRRLSVVGEARTASNRMAKLYQITKPTEPQLALFQ